MNTKIRRIISDLFGTIHNVLARSRLMVWLAVKSRNQALCVIERALTPFGAAPEMNGEYDLLERLKGKIDRFVDVGANVGDWTAAVLKYANSTAKGILIEPNPTADKVLQKRFSGNQNISVIAAAASDREETVQFFQETDCGLTSSIVPGVSAHAATMIEVEAISVDRVLSNRGWTHVDLVKVDAEGHDFSVIKGMAKSLESHSINLLQFEYNSSWALNGSTLGHCIQWLKHYRYEVKLISHLGIVPFFYDDFGECFRYSNFLAATPKKWAEYNLTLQNRNR